MSTSSWRWLLIVFGVAVVMRGGWVIARYGTHQRWQALAYPDETAYLTVAQSLASGDGLKDDLGYRATYMPAYPAFLAIFADAERGLFWARLVQAVLAAWVAPATFLLARTWSELASIAPGSREQVARLAGLAAAFDPFLMFFSGLLLTEVLFAAALVTAWWLVLTIAAKPGPGTHRTHPLKLTDVRATVSIPPGGRAVPSSALRAGIGGGEPSRRLKPPATTVRPPGEDPATVRFPDEGPTTVQSPGEGPTTVRPPGEGRATVRPPGEQRSCGAEPVRLSNLWIFGAGAGSAFVVCVMLRPGAIVLIVAAATMMLMNRRRSMPALAATAVMLLVVVAGLLPWAARNARVIGEWRWLTTRGGISLYDGLRQGATGASDLAHTKTLPVVAELRETEWDRYFRREAIDAAVQDPGRVLHLAWAKLLRTWNPLPNVEEHRRGVTAIVSAAWMTGVLGFALIGGWRYRRAVGAWAMLLLPVVTVTLMHMVFVGSVRYRVPVMPMLVVLAAAGIGSMATAGRRDSGTAGRSD